MKSFFIITVKSWIVGLEKGANGIVEPAEGIPVPAALEVPCGCTVGPPFL